MSQTLLRTIKTDMNALTRDIDDLLETSRPYRPIALHFSKKPSVLILGGSFAGLETAQKIRRYKVDPVVKTVF